MALTLDQRDNINAKLSSSTITTNGTDETLLMQAEFKCFMTKSLLRYVDLMDIIHIYETPFRFEKENHMNSLRAINVKIT